MGKHDSFGRSMNVQEQRYCLGRLCTMVMLYMRPPYSFGRSGRIAGKHDSFGRSMNGNVQEQRYRFGIANKFALLSASAYIYISKYEIGV